MRLHDILKAFLMSVHLYWVMDIQADVGTSGSAYYHNYPHGTTSFNNTPTHWKMLFTCASLLDKILISKTQW